MRYVIHDHIVENRHFDLMIETEDDFLRTWRIMPPDLDMMLKGNEIKGNRIQDHEKFFLDYEGSLSRGNGSVVIFDSGDSKLLKKKNNIFVFVLSGHVLKGTLHLIDFKDNIYNIQYFPEYTKQ